MDKAVPPDVVEPPAYLQDPDIREMFNRLPDRLDNQSPERRTKALVGGDEGSAPFSNRREKELSIERHRLYNLIIPSGTENER